MTQYMIHTYPSRLWYVEQYLIPSMKKQGIKKSQIIVYNDSMREGQLTSFIQSCGYTNYIDTWHLQDDIIISSKFKEQTDKYDEGIVCGFCNGYSQGQPGVANIYNMWYSMPCIRIPGHILYGFINWIYSPATRKKYMAYFKDNKHDDLFLQYYLQENYAKIIVYNIAPNLVNHIDHLLGGSIINKERSQSTEYIMSKYWEEPELLVELEKTLVLDKH